MVMSSIRFLGKHLNIDNKELFSFSGSGFEFNVIPHSKNYKITFYFLSEINEDEKQYVSIFINNKRYKKERLASGKQQITISINDLNKALIKVIKETETCVSNLYLEDIVLENASIDENIPHNRPLIGFFGDSLTCGYGLLDYHGTTYNTEYQEESIAYPHLCAEKLDMDYLIVARSGISVALKIYVDKLFKEIYDTVDMTRKCQYDRKLDYAVFNLGTNDNGAYSLLNDEKEKEESYRLFKKEYIELIEKVIKDNPGVKIVILYDMVILLEDTIKVIKEIYQYIKEHHDNQIELLRLNQNADGACGHPYYPAHEEAASMLAEVIKKMR